MAEEQYETPEQEPSGQEAPPTETAPEPPPGVAPLEGEAPEEQETLPQEEARYDKAYIMSSDPASFGVKQEDIAGTVRMLEMERGAFFLTRDELVEAVNRYLKREV
jgi:hypothetical protein